MRVNPACKGPFNNLLVIATLAILFIATSFTERPDRDLWAKRVNLLIRQIGHQLLLQAGDSTSSILPVTEIKEGVFKLAFDNEFVFSHDSLMALSQSLLPKTQFPSGYTVTVHDMNESIVYGFQYSNTSSDLVACVGRNQPSGHYIIEIAFPDLYKKAEKKKAPSGSKVEVENIKPKLTELKTATVKNEVPITPQPDQSFPFINFIISGMLVILAGTLLIGRFRRKTPKLPSVGKFIVDTKNQCLLLRNEVISLSDKEYKILELLNKNFGKLTPRETLMQEIWIREGVITGRSLDVFVSKLRKKLTGDPELRITNIHGKGYKLEINGDLTSTSSQ